MLRYRLNNQILQISNIKYKARILYSFICLFVYLLIASQSSAQTMTNDMYRIQMGNFNSISGESANDDYNISITSGETTPGLFEGKNYKVKSGFQYVPRSSPFSFAISNINIDFGLLTPTNPVIRSTILTVTNTELDGYNVSAAQNHELQVPTTGAKINDTTCDDGRCTDTIASEWMSTLTYGFGYRCEREILSCVEGDSSFLNSNYYKQFPDSSQDESAASVMTGGRGVNMNSTVLYKVNISSSQPPGTYSNTVTYLATPNY